VTESFLQYIWQYQYFDRKELKTSQGEIITVIRTGTLNQHAGPDFIHANINIDSVEWAGHVEIHVKASEWVQHKHDLDKAYDNVILHVVWDQDNIIKRSDGTVIPTLELKGRTNNELFRSYKKLINQPHPVPCAGLLSQVPSIVRTSTIERALIKRLESKSKVIAETLKKNNNDWEETTYQVLGKNFGFKVNAEPFEKLVQIVSYKTILKHADKLQQVEALLLGAAGLINKRNDEYSELIAKEFNLLGTKYSLHEKQLHKSQWRFLRLRPANFPTIRIAQFASFLCGQKHLFSAIIATESARELKQLLDVTQSVYWQKHYQLGKPAAKIIAGLGESAMENIIINTVAPLLAAYSKQKDEPLWMERAVDFLSSIPPENNSITRLWQSIDWKAKSAFDSQGLIELKNNYCAKRLCLHCTIGTSILKPS
jgi:hypothetical protein